MFLAERRHERELYEKLSLEALAGSGDGKAVKQQLEKLERDQ